jgi:rfaE bifunctional protein kinase chain/domain
MTEISTSSLRRWVTRLAGQCVLVVGDIILDEYLIGRAARLSREAPIPVLEFETRVLIPGGAANPAANIAALGSKAIQIGVIGADAEATSLRQVLQARGIETTSLVIDGGRATTVKTRVMAQMGLRFPQQVARLDRVDRTPLSEAIERAVRAMIVERIDTAGAVLLSDYHIALLTPSLVTAVRQLCEARTCLLAADAQGDLEKYTGFGLVKCNADEAQAFLRRPLRSHADFAAAASELCSRLALTRCMAITRGADGATIATPDGRSTHCPAPATSEVYDTVGAGDTAVAVMTLALAAGAEPVEAAALANTASGLVVRRVGNYAPTPDELAEALDADR